MKERIKHKQLTGQMNHQTADSRANASVYLFFTIEHFLKTIFTNRTSDTFTLAPAQKADHSAKLKEQLFANPQTELIINSINL